MALCNNKKFKEIISNPFSFLFCKAFKRLLELSFSVIFKVTFQILILTLFCYYRQQKLLSKSLTARNLAVL